MGSHHHRSSKLPNRVARRIFPSAPPISIDGPSKLRAIPHLNTSNVQHVYHVSSCDKRSVTIDILPDEILLKIFHFYRLACLNGLEAADLLWDTSWRWHRLVHVNSRWRSVVFASSSSLDLRLVCDPMTRVDLIRIWPPFPIIIRNTDSWLMPEDYDFDAAIAHNNRVCEINLHLTRSQLQNLVWAMREQLPALIHLTLGYPIYHGSPAPALPDGFLGGSAPQLQSLKLESIPFPALPKFLLSATDLVRLTLWNIPHSGYISPEAMVTCLSTLNHLERLSLGFRSPQSRPQRENRRPTLATRTVLSALTRFEFHGVSEYLDDLVARIDAPLLDSIFITFFHQLIFDISQFAQFMRRTTKFQALNEAHVDFDYSDVSVGYLPPAQIFDKKSGLRILCRELDWQLSSLAQIFTSFFPSTQTVEHLYIYGPRYSPLDWQDDIENVEWLEMFRPFTAVRNLYVCKEFAQYIAPALQELIGERVTEVLPSLESIFWEELQPLGPVREAVGQFVAARQLSGHPTTVSLWERNLEWKLRVRTSITKHCPINASCCLRAPLP